MARSEIRSLKAMLGRVADSIAKSPLGQVELDAEPAIRDFIVDRMLVGTELATSVRAMIEVCA